MAATAEEEDEQELDISAMTLLEVEQQILGHTARHSQKLALLQVLAVMCQSLPYTVLLGKTAQVSGKKEKSLLSLFTTKKKILCI